MNKFVYHGDGDFLSSYLFRLQCRMEKTPGIIIVAGKDYHVDARGRYSGEWPPFALEFAKLTTTLYK